jgi:hypothetical protein
MKKTISLFISFISLMNYSNAQKSSIGFTAGATFSSYKAKIMDVESISVTSKTKVGFTVGVTSSFGLDQHFSFQPALNYIQKGGVLKEEGINDKTTLNYFELPLNFVYNAHSSKGKFFIGAGPSLSMGLSGKDKYDDGTNPQNSDIKFGSADEDDFKAFETGINFLTGYQCKGGFLIAANYNVGLSNLANSDPQLSDKYHNRYFGIRIGYMFGRK